MSYDGVNRLLYRENHMLFDLFKEAKLSLDLDRDIFDKNF